jgi:transcriptional regulator with XRE-family HTH domain
MNKKSVDEIVGQNVRMLRNAKGMSQTKLADSLGVSFQQLQKYESGKNSFRPDRMLQIANVFDIPVLQLFDGTDSGKRRKPDRTTDLLTATPHAMRMLQAFAKLSDDKLRLKMLNLTEAMV